MNMDGARNWGTNDAYLRRVEVSRATFVNVFARIGGGKFPGTSLGSSATFTMIHLVRPPKPILSDELECVQTKPVTLFGGIYFGRGRLYPIYEFRPGGRIRAKRVSRYPPRPVMPSFAGGSGPHSYAFFASPLLEGVPPPPIGELN